MRLIGLLSLLLLFGCNESEKKPETIRVTGEGKVRIKPDQVILTIEVSFTEPRMADAVRLSQTTVDSVVSILKSYSNSENDVKTSSVTANKHYEYNGRTEVFKGFVAHQSIDFVLNDINQFTDLTGKLLHTRISKIGQVQFTHSKRDSLFREADLLAYDDANRSARKLCDRAERQLGRLVFMTNDKGNSMYDENSHSIGEINTYAKGYGGNGFKISPEVLEFKRTVVSEYIIE
jgi:uncharacterized protein YggE